MKKVSILFLANSFSDDTIQYMPEIARDFGYELDLYNLYIGGCDINHHINNILNRVKEYELRSYNKEKQTWETFYNIASTDFIPSRKWDYIVLQQSSYFSGLPNGLENIETLVELVKDLANKDVKLVWNMTWAYPKYSDLEVFKNDYKNDQNFMYQSILNNVKERIVTNKDFEKIIPNGTALQNAREYIDEHLLHRDGFHLGYQFGRFLAGLTAVGTLLDVDLSNVKYHPVEIPDELMNDYIKCAKDAIKDPWKTTLKS